MLIGLDSTIRDRQGYILVSSSYLNKSQRPRLSGKRKPTNQLYDFQSFNAIKIPQIAPLLRCKHHKTAELPLSQLVKVRAHHDLVIWRRQPLKLYYQRKIAL